MPLNVYIFNQSEGLKTYSDPEILGKLPSNGLIWIDIEEQDGEVLQIAANELGLHELTVEDCLDPGHSPKIEAFPNYHFMVFRSLIPAHLPEQMSEEGEQEEQEEDDRYTAAIGIFLSDNFLLTHRRRDVPWLDAVLRQVKQQPEANLALGTNVLAHRVIDVLTDRFLRGLGYFETLIDQTEDQVVSDPEDFQISELFELKRTLTLLRQIMRDQKTVLGRLAHDSSVIGEQKVRRYFRDIEDHSKAILKALDQQIDTLLGVRDVYFALANVRLGDIMRILAVITTIAVPLNLVVGMYGMNFKVIPLLHHPRGFWFIVVLMISVVFLLMMLFRRKKWL